MSGFEWSEDNLPTLGRIFLRNVCDHMRKDPGAVVQFGETGMGVQPNYQVTYSNGVRKVLRGSSHKSYEHAEEFNIGRISSPFTLAQIEVARERT